jgi:hypothetical protein
VTSSVDPSLEIEAITARLTALGNPFYEGVEQDTVLAVDGFSRIVPYRDLQPGSMIPAATGRLLGAGEQAQPYVWAFQIAHVAPTRKLATKLATQTDIALIGWAPSVNASKIGTFYFTVYDSFDKNGERVGWTATRFYETTLGQSPDFGAAPPAVIIPNTVTAQVGETV